MSDDKYMKVNVKMNNVTYENVFIYRRFSRRCRVSLSYSKKPCTKGLCMSPVSLVFYTEETVNIPTLIGV